MSEMWNRGSGRITIFRMKLTLKSVLELALKLFVWLFRKPYTLHYRWTPGREPVSLSTEIVLKSAPIVVCIFDGHQKRLAHKWAFMHLATLSGRPICPLERRV